MTLYNDYDLIIYLYIYSLIGWCLQTIYFYVAEGSVKNRSMLNQPLLLTYGISMVCLILQTGLSSENVILQVIINALRVALIQFIAEFICEKIIGLPLRDPVKRVKNEISPRWTYILAYIVVASVMFAIFKVVHPFIYMVIAMLPQTLVRIISLICGISMLADILLVIISAKKLKKNMLAAHWQEEQNKIRMTMIYRIGYNFQKRIQNTYPELKKYTDDYEGLEKMETAAKNKGIVFAQGMSLYKLVWVFLITSFLGDIIETIYCFITSGVLMRRSGVVFGPFSVVWGLGAMLLSAALYGFAGKKKLRIFLGGFIFGGTYEYLASLILEVFFHTKFWDYSHMVLKIGDATIPLNIGGRTNIPFMLAWGFLALVWICICYPVMSNLIEKFPPVAGAVVTWILVIFMVLDLGVTAAVMLRYNVRKHDKTAHNQFEYYLDQSYSDQVVEKMWPNLISTEKKAEGKTTS